MCALFYPASKGSCIPDHISRHSEYSMYSFTWHCLKHEWANAWVNAWMCLIAHRYVYNELWCLVSNWTRDQRSICSQDKLWVCIALVEWNGTLQHTCYRVNANLSWESQQWCTCTKDLWTLGHTPLWIEYFVWIMQENLEQTRSTLATQQCWEYQMWRSQCRLLLTLHFPSAS